MTLSVARRYRLYANNHPCGVNGVEAAAARAGANDRRRELIRSIDMFGLFNPD
jgi:hypothetical protein